MGRQVAVHLLTGPKTQPCGTGSQSLASNLLERAQLGSSQEQPVCLRDSAGCNLRWLKTDTQAVELLAKFPLLPGSLKGSHEPLMWERGFDIVEIMT